MLTIFDFKNNEIRFVDGKPVANDVAKILGYVNPADTIRKKVKDKYKGVSRVETPGGMQNVVVLEEAGIYQLILSCKLPIAEEFQDWVFQEVLPQIRKTGGYSSQKIPSPSPAEAIIQMGQLMLEHEQRIKRITAKQAQQEKELENLNSELEILNLETQGNSAELDRFRNGQGHWFSVLAYAKLNDTQISLNQAQSLGRKATALCKINDIVPEKITDPRFGTVHTYPEWILSKIFQVN